MPEHILPLPPKWEKNVESGWVVYQSGDDDIRGYFAKPKGGDSLPGIVMVPENLGVIEHRQDVTRRFAKAGYACITLDPYSRIGGVSPRDFTTHEERRRKASLVTPDEQVVPDLEATRRYLESRNDVDASRIGAIGYCAGGGHLYGWILGNSNNVTCAVMYYGATSVAEDARPDGKAIDRIASAEKLQCPILIHHGDADRAVPLDNARAMVAALEKTGQPVTFHIYPGADHAFHDDTHPAYHPGASEESWARTLEFFAHHLGRAS